MHVAFPRIIPRIIPPNHTRESYHESYPWFWSHVLKHQLCFWMALASRDDLCFVALSLVCTSIYLPVCHAFLFMGGAKTATGVTITHVLSVGSKSKWICRSQLHARIIPRIIPDTYPESYLNFTLLCHGPVDPFKNKLWELRGRIIPRIIPPKHTSNHTPWCNTLCWARSFRKGPVS